VRQSWKGRDVKIDSGYIDAVNEKLRSQDPEFIRNYSLEIDSFNDVPVMEASRALDEATVFGMSWDNKVLMTRHSILGKKVVISYKGKPIGPGFVMNRINDPLDSFPELKSAPAFRFLVDACVSHLMEKSLPPQESEPPAAAGTRGLPKSSSVGGQAR